MPTTTRFLWVVASHEPVPIGIDANKRQMFSLNFTAAADQAPVEKLEESIARLLYDNSLGALGTDVWIGSMSVVPSGPGPFTEILRSGGYAPLATHNDGKYGRPSFQIVVRAASYVVARTRAMAIWRLLDGLYNESVTVA